MDVYSHIPSCFRFWPVPNSPVRLTSPGLTDRFLCLAAESALVKEHGLVQKCGIPKLYLEEKNILILSNGIYPKFRLIGIMFLTSRPCGAELPFMISHHQSYQRWKTVFLPPSPHQVGSGKKCAKLQRLVVQSGPESVYNMFKMLQVCHSYQPPGNGSICVAPPTRITILMPLGLSPEMYNEGPPTEQTIVGSKFRQGDVANSGIPYSAPKVHRDIAIKMVFGGQICLINGHISTNKNFERWTPSLAALSCR